MKIVDIREATVPIRSDIRNAFIDFSEMTVSTLVLTTDVVREGRPVVGFGFHSNGRYAQGGILRERLIPRVLRAPAESLLDDGGGNFSPERVWAAAMANEKPGGHGDRAVAMSTLDMAVWDAVAKIAGQPLHRLLAERHGTGEPLETVPVYGAGGYYDPEKGVAGLQDEMRHYLDLGYTTVKMKIGAASLDEDKRRIEAVLEIVGSGEALAVDANGRFDLETAVAYGEMLTPYGLHWYEEPGDPLDYALQAELSKVYAGAMATGENLFSRQDAVNLLRYAGMRPDRDILMFDPALCYGLVEYLRILEAVAAHGWEMAQVAPHGGNQFALAIAAGLRLGANEAYPGVFQPFGGFVDSTPIEAGHVRLPETPGIGIEDKAALYRVFKPLLDG